MESGPLSIVDFAGVAEESKPKGKRSPSTAYRAHDRALVEVGEMRGAGATRSWEDAKPAHFVALYVWLHGEVYGARPVELRSDAWWGAVSAAGSMLRNEFGGEPLRFLDFVRWTWRRERDREKRAGDEQRDSRRIGWRLQFLLKHLLTDYRVANARAGKAVNQ